ncbi:MAG: hypothetical protein ACJ8CR_23230 [Roseiflexaceae bacterium]
MTADQNTAATERRAGSQPLLAQHGLIIQEYGTLRLLPIALSHEARLLSCQLLNQNGKAVQVAIGYLLVQRRPDGNPVE